MDGVVAEEDVATVKTVEESVAGDALLCAFSVRERLSKDSKKDWIVSKRKTASSFCTFEKEMENE